ncbi:ATP-binding protein [Emcibacter sp.]|uniref:ATP-binding protein n=1 Tax=Emcibacter sp. TaxID=1979954 RepID=UPI003A8E3356
MVETLKYLSLRNRLSNRLLLLTIGFVMLAEVLIYVPSIANFRHTWLKERLGAAQIAILAIEAAPDYMVGEKLSWQLLDSAGVLAIVRKKDDNRELVLGTDKPLDVEARYDIRSTDWWDLVVDAFGTMIHQHPNSRLIEVTGYTSDVSMDFLQIIFEEEHLCHAMFNYSRNVLLVSIIISLMTAVLVYVTLSRLLVRPVQKITDSMIAFREAPEDTRRQIVPEDRQDEIGVVMQELSVMQDEVRRALNQKTHLANLGVAVSKINHDLRNILASAQLVSDHLTTLKDPTVQKLTPRFVSAIDRAIRLCENTLQYGRAEVEKPRLETVPLKPLIDDMAISLGCPEDGPVRIVNNLPANLTAAADPDQLFRVFLNLGRNAVQAMEHVRLNKGELTITGRPEDASGTIIEFCDNGPGIPARIQESLFHPFHGSSNGGAGLGLAIAREIIEAHGGHITLTDSGPEGTCFRIELPAA